VLFTIDPRPFDAALKQAKATLARDKYLAENATIEVVREANLLEKKVSSQSDYDKRKSDADAAAALVEADEAAVENARLQLEYCTITSPLTGRTGDILVDQGNLMKANDAAMVSIEQVRPIRVSFSIPQGDLPAVKKAMSTGKLEVRAILPKEEPRPEAGELTFVDNNVNSTTGMIQLQASFPNENERLWPGLYVNVSLVLAVDRNAVVVPAKAVQTGQKGRYVYVVKADNTTEYRAVTVRRSSNVDAIIDTGLAKDETVVTDGHLRVTDGTKVEIKTGLGGAATSQSSTAPSPATAPAAGAETADRGGRP
jgi:multidrug efflux system membrane fusion protein